MNDWLKFEKNGSVVTLTMNRPDIRNPLGDPEDVIYFEEASNLINDDRFFFFGLPIWLELGTLRRANWPENMRCKHFVTLSRCSISLIWNANFAPCKLTLRDLTSAVPSLASIPSIFLL